MARNTKAVPTRVTFVEAFAAMQTETKAKGTMAAWARGLIAAKKRNETKAEFMKRMMFAAGEEIKEAGEEYFGLLDQSLLKPEKGEPQYKMATKIDGKSHSLYSACNDYANEKFPKKELPPPMVDKDVIKELTRVFKARGITTKEAAMGFLAGLAAS